MRVRRKPVVMPRTGPRAVLGLLGLLCGLVALLATPLARAATDAATGAKVGEPDDDGVSAIVETEEIILTLTPLLADLDRSAMNLRLPDHNSERLFFTDVRYTELSRTVPPRDVAVPHNRLVDRRVERICSGPIRGAVRQPIQLGE